MLIRIYIAFIFFVLAYYSQISSSGSSADDFYPLYSWSLFTSPTFKQQQFYIYVIDKKCELSLCQPREEFWDYEMLVQLLGKQYKNNETSAFLESKRKLEETNEHILHHQEYELRFRELDPVEYVKNKKTITDELVVKMKSFD